MEFEPRDRAVYLPSADVLVCADLHIGRDATSNVELRVGEHEDLTERLEALCVRYEPAEVIVAGDLLHSFERIPTGVAKTIRAVRQVVEAAGARLVVTPGNHDPLLAELFDGPTPLEYRLDDHPVVVTHGHVPPERDADLYVVGHDHPTIEIEGVRHPCYLYDSNQYRDAAVLMLPAFSRLPAGVVINDMSTSAFLSPLLTDADSLRPIVRDERADETHEFPPLDELRRFL